LKSASTLIGLALFLGGFPASAQITREPVAPYPDPSKFARGFYSEGEIGTLVFLGDARKPLGPGAALGLRVGYDVFSWLAVNVHAFGSTHTTSFAGAPQSGQLLQILQATAEVKLSVRIGQVSTSAFGGVGLARLSTNLLGTTLLTDSDLRNTPVLLAGGALDYHILSRHFSFGITGAFARYQLIYTTGAIAGTAYIRYTF
jgi:hypothetical protein